MMRYEDLEFEPATGHRSKARLQHVIVEFPNGRFLSIVRGLCSAGLRQDFETARLGEEPIGHFTVESVQAEMDAVAALPVALSDPQIGSA